MKDDQVYLEYIMECIRRIEKHRRSGKRRFLASDTLQDAVLRNLQTLAESTQRLSGEIKATQPDVPWEEISGFRNILVHGYLGIDLEVVWGIIQTDVSNLKAAIYEMRQIVKTPEE